MVEDRGDHDRQWTICGNCWVEDATSLRWAKYATVPVFETMAHPFFSDITVSDGLCTATTNPFTPTTTPTMKEKFLQLFMSEPEKSFRKAGITNGDGFLTSEGTTVFLTWLLKKNSTAFLDEVVKPMLAEDEKK